VMDLCRPIPFRENEVPSVTSLVGNVLRRRSESQPSWSCPPRSTCARF